MSIISSWQLVMRHESTMNSFDKEIFLWLTLLILEIVFPLELSETTVVYLLDTWYFNTKTYATKLCIILTDFPAEWGAWYTASTLALSFAFLDQITRKIKIFSSLAYHIKHFPRKNQTIRAESKSTRLNVNYKKHFNVYMNLMKSPSMQCVVNFYIAVLKNMVSDKPIPENRLNIILFCKLAKVNAAFQLLLYN